MTWEKKKRKRNTYDSNKENISYNLNINSSASNINYLKELNKKDQKKINDIHNILKASRIPKRNLKVKQLQLNSAKNNEINRSINFNENENKSTLYSRIDLNDSKKMKTNKHRNKIKQKINKNCLYFNTEEKEILAEYYKQRDREKIMTRNKDNSKYELTVKRLLEQQTLKKVGPKRRETIRNEGDKILKIVKQIIQLIKLQMLNM